MDLISTDTFYKEVMQNFREIHTKVDTIDKNVDDLCTRTSILETEYKTHVATEVKKSEKKYKYITVIISCVVVMSAIYNTLVKH